MSHDSNDGAVAIGCFLLTILMVIMFYIASPARSQEASPPPCARAADIQSQLEKQYGETVTAGGMVGDQYMVVLTNPISGTFTIIMRRLDGVGCIVMGGTGFALANPATKKGNGL